jgi:hypothetical protein
MTRGRLTEWLTALAEWLTALATRATARLSQIVQAVQVAPMRFAQGRFLRGAIGLVLMVALASLGVLLAEGVARWESNSRASYRLLTTAETYTIETQMVTSPGNTTTQVVRVRRAVKTPGRTKTLPGETVRLDDTVVDVETQRVPFTQTVVRRVTETVVRPVTETVTKTETKTVTTTVTETETFVTTETVRHKDPDDD